MLQEGNQYFLILSKLFLQAKQAHFFRMFHQISTHLCCFYWLFFVCHHHVGPQVALISTTDQEKYEQDPKEVPY